MALKIVSWNARALCPFDEKLKKQRFDLLQKLLNKHDIVAIQESHHFKFSSDKDFHF